MVIVALTGRRLGRTDKWPYSGAAALPRAYIDAVVRAGGTPVLVNDARDPKELLGRVDALVLVCPELDHDLAPEAVGLGDPTDGEQVSRRRCPRWPGRRPWRRPR